ncbi:polyprenol reductase-like [Pogonomyrmex barbatus]|uniref:Polyprenal reductase n=1 Tax=Pogonomyrmex barbatus TaxID=144034 RepID=A0A6I9VMH4_9HYME|nr:polyprenol reductase-like [Pogonomyrmex barbatus]
MLSLIGESVGFVRGSHMDFSLRKLTSMQLMCIFIFLWSTYTQLRMNFILARLRKNQYGDIVTKDHKIPFGELFNYITNPLQFTEILVYVTMSGILWQASTFHYITFFVIMNQVCNGFIKSSIYFN